MVNEAPVCEVDEYGGKSWYLNGKLHRIDGPAIEYASGNKSWWLNGNLYRIDGPAVEYADGNKAWYLNGIRYKFEEYCQQLNLPPEEIMILKLKYC